MSSRGDICENWRDISSAPQDSHSLKWNPGRNEVPENNSFRYPDQTPNIHNKEEENGHSRNTWPNNENADVISDQALTEILEKSDLDALTIKNLTSKEFDRLLDKRLSTETMCLVISILRRAVSILVDGNTRLNLYRFNCSFLTNHLPLFISGLNRHISKSENRDKFLNITEDLLVFLQQFHATSPAATVDIVHNTITSLDAQFAFINKKDSFIPYTILNLLREIQESVKNENETDDRPSFELGATYVRPPYNFRYKNICPTEVEIFGDDYTFVQKNIIKGKYVNTEHYLDVQFRLLHEDFFRGLRNGILEYMMLIKTVDKDKIEKVKDLNVYNVRIGDSKLKGADLVYKVTFDTSRLRTIQWQVELILFLSFQIE